LKEEIQEKFLRMSEGTDQIWSVDPEMSVVIVEVEAKYNCASHVPFDLSKR